MKEAIKQPTEPPHASTWEAMRIGCTEGERCGYPFCWCVDWLERGGGAEKTQAPDPTSEGTPIS